MMRKHCGILIAAAVSAALLLVSASSVSADTIKIYYKEDKDILVSFPDGMDIERGGDLTVVVSSVRYDMANSGIMFYECDAYGIPDRTTSVTPEHITTFEGNAVTHIFRNLEVDIEMSFSELKELTRPPESIVEPSAEVSTSVPDIDPLTVVMAVSTILAAIMLAVMTDVVRRIDSFLKGQGEAS